MYYPLVWTRVRLLKHLNYVFTRKCHPGLAISTIIIFFCLQFPASGNIGINNIQAWWGNNVYKNTADWNGTPLKQLTPGQTFGYVTDLSAPLITFGLILISYRPSSW